MHYLEAWNEAVCDGAWGPVAAVLGEKMRQALDLEHWAAFGESLERMMGIVKAVGTGERGEPPATIVALSGDVHHAYLAEVGFPPGTGMRSTAWQATCSPFRNPLDNKERTVMRFMASDVGVAADARAGGSRRGSRRRACAGATPTTSRGSTTRWRRSSSTAGTRAWCSRRPSGARARTRADDLRLERVFERDIS